MNNNLKTKGKTLIKLLLDRTLHKNTGLNLWISEVHLSFLIIKLSWKNISLFLLQKRSIRVCIIRTLVWSFKTLKKKQWNDTYFTRSKISYFLFASPANPPPPTPTGQDRIKQFPIPHPKRLDLSRGVDRSGVVTGQIEPWISTCHAVVTMKRSLTMIRKLYTKE